MFLFLLTSDDLCFLVIRMITVSYTYSIIINKTIIPVPAKRVAEKDRLVSTPTHTPITERYLRDLNNNNNNSSSKIIYHHGYLKKYVYV